MMSIQIHARGSRIFLLKWCNTAHSECPKIRYYLPKTRQFPGQFSTIVTIISVINSNPDQHVSTKANTFRYTRGVFLFVCFVALRPKSTAMVMAGRSVHLTTLFPGQA